MITREEWEKKLNAVKLRKEDMNTLVMNFLVTEGYVEAAEKFQRESGTKRILFVIPVLSFVSGIGVFDVWTLDYLLLLNSLSRNSRD